MPIKINGSSSGYTEIKAADAAANNTLTLPSASGTLMTTGGSNTFTANQVIEVTDNSNAALRITQLGTGNALVVEDSTNPDSTPTVIDASGNVGIGTSTPIYKLDVNKGSAGNIARFTDGVAQTLAIQTLDTSGVTFRNDNGGYLAFNAGNAERMRIGTGGQVFFGGITSSISGNEGGVIQSQSSSKAASFSTTAGAGANCAVTAGRSSSDGAVVEFYRSGSGVGSINVSSTATSYATSSDYRLKDDVIPINNATIRLLALKPVNFAWKVNGSRVDGFLAHEAQEVVPEAVTGAKDAVDESGNPVYQGIDQSKLVPLLTAALQEALTEIADLKTRITALEGGAA